MNMSKTKIKNLNLDQIRIDGGTQPRVETDNGLIEEYLDLYQNGTELPPVTVFFDDAGYWLADGFHRYLAQKKLGRDTIKSKVHKGTQRDAILFSVGANADHGKRRTNADKRKAIETLLTNPHVSMDDEGGPWADRDIARRCRVSAPTVAKYRHTIKLYSTGSLEDVTKNEAVDEQSRSFIHHKTGKPTSMRTGNIGRPRWKFNPTGGIARDAFSTRQPHSQCSPVPMRNVNLPLNNPQRAAQCMFSVYGEEYMLALCKELNTIFRKKGFSNDE